ncbi:hypothetical protein EB73_06690 [Mycobacterium sp. SWH-M3]|nr:hypothetical protein EB73_06690 [Mycobacterium sp. SWH-M3]
MRWRARRLRVRLFSRRGCLQRRRRRSRKLRLRGLPRCLGRWGRLRRCLLLPRLPAPRRLGRWLRRHPRLVWVGLGRFMLRCRRSVHRSCGVV